MDAKALDLVYIYKKAVYWFDIEISNTGEPLHSRTFTRRLTTGSNRTEYGMRKPVVNEIECLVDRGNMLSEAERWKSFNTGNKLHQKVKCGRWVRKVWDNSLTLLKNWLERFLKARATSRKQTLDDAYLLLGTTQFNADFPPVHRLEKISSHSLPSSHCPRKSRHKMQDKREIC